MVNSDGRPVGFICEGETEKLLVESTRFQQLLASYRLACVGVIDATGCDNLLPHRVEVFRSILIDKGAEKVIILTDLDEDQCLTLTKNRITHRPDQVICVAVKKIEAWWLADTLTLSRLLGKKDYKFKFPERESNPFEVIRSLVSQHTGNRIDTSKIKLANKLLNLGFSLESAAQHPRCPSARYLLDKLRSLG